MRSTTPIPVKGCKFRLNAHQKLQLYLAFVRSTTPIPVKGCKFRPNPCEGLQVSNPCEELQIRALDPPIPVKGCKVRALDHANPCEGLQSAPHNVSLYLAFVRSTLPIPIKGCKVRMAICHFTSRSCARPRESLSRVASCAAYFVTLPRVRAFDHANPCEGFQVAPHTLSLYLAFVRSTTRIPVKGCIPDRWGWCHPGYNGKINIPR